MYYLMYKPVIKKGFRFVDSEAPDCYSKVGNWPFCLEIAFMRSQPCTLLGSRNCQSIKCIAHIWIFGLCCCVVNNLNQWFLIASTFGRPNTVLFLSHRNTQRLPGTAASTLLRFLKPRHFSLREHLCGITQIFPHCDIDMWGLVWRSRFRGCGWVLTFINNISLDLRL